MERNYVLKNCSLVCAWDGSIRRNSVIPVVFTERGGVFGNITEGEPDGALSGRVIDLHGNYVVPGLINAHVHLFSSGGPVNAMLGGNAQKLLFTAMGSACGKRVLRGKMEDRLEAMLCSGVTTARCVGDFFFQDLVCRDRIKAGKSAGPRIQVSGPIISAPGGHGAPYLAREAGTPEEGAALVRKFAREGVDLIKICATGGVTDAKKVGEAGKVQMSPEMVRAICAEAHANALPVAAHAQSTEGVKIALRGGVDTIEHGSVMDQETVELYQNNPLALRGYSYLVPTIYAGVPGLIDRNITGFSSIVLENSAAVFQGMLRGIGQALDAGIRMGLGTDAGMPYVTHYNTWRELTYLCRYADISPAQALHLATAGNAELMGLGDETGTIETGKSADFLVLEGDPLRDIAALRLPVMVAARGNLIGNPRIRPMKAVEDALATV